MNCLFVYLIYASNYIRYSKSITDQTALEGIADMTHYFVELGDACTHSVVNMHATNGSLAVFVSTYFMLPH